jgi:hypothetical protein
MVTLYGISILYTKQKISFLIVLIATLHSSSFFSGTDRKTKKQPQNSVLAKIGTWHFPDTRSVTIQVISTEIQEYKP